MKYQIVAPRLVQATISLPASKSISNRALIIHALAQGTHTPQNLSHCDDTAVMIDALAPYSGPRPQHIDIKAAGTAMRFLTAYLSVNPGQYLITGTQRMRQRPIRILVDALRTLGADITYAGQEGYPPLLIAGHAPQGAEQASQAAEHALQTLTLPGSVSSQYISALLMIAPLLPHGLNLELTGQIISRPYIDLTLNLMRLYGAKAGWTDSTTLTVAHGTYSDTPFVVESDWSAASYWYQILALNAHYRRLHRTELDNEIKVTVDGEVEVTADGEIGGTADDERKTATSNEGRVEEDNKPQQPCVELLGLFADSHQGDSRVADYFGRLGIRTEFTEQGVRLTPMGLPVARFVEDMTDTPDLAQTVVVTCCLMGIPFRLSGLQSLRIKETDRIAALITELHRLGYVVREEQPGLLVWNGERSPQEQQAVVQTYDDHRMAMAFAPAALMGTPISIDHPEVVSKSYPHFWEHLRLAGFKVNE